MENQRSPEAQKVSRQTDKLKLNFEELKEKNGSVPERSDVEIIKPPAEKKPIDFDSFLEFFSGTFEIFEGKKFDPDANDREPIKFLKTFFYYLSGDKRFFSSPLLMKGSQYPEPSLEKGLFIIGGYGCGKTSIIKTVYKILERAEREPFIALKNVDGDLDILKRYGLRFQYYTANEVKQNFETIPKEDEAIFWSNHKGGRIYYDDMTSEELVSKFGRTEIFKSILENRYNSGARTMLSLNYNEDDPTVDATLNLFGNRYGARVYDRIYEMFNIIVLTGKSLRK